MKNGDNQMLKRKKNMGGGQSKWERKGEWFGRKEKKKGYNKMKIYV